MGPQSVGTHASMHVATRQSLAAFDLGPKITSRWPPSPQPSSASSNSTPSTTTLNNPSSRAHHLAERTPFPSPSIPGLDSKNRGRKMACGASGPLRRPRKGHKSPILVGSKTDPTVRMLVKDEAMHEALATFAEDMAPRVFFSGKAGWHTLGKINVDGQRSPHKPSCWTSRRNTPVTGVLRARVPTIQARLDSRY